MESPAAAFYLLTLAAPWVHNKQSEVFLWNVVSKLPIGMLDSWNTLGKFIHTQIAPSISWSGGLFSSMAGAFSKTEEVQAPDQRFDTTPEVGRIMEKLLRKWFFAEDTTAANEEAKLCLKKDGSVDWNACDDYEAYVRMLCSQEKALRESNEDQTKLKVRAFFAESDVMIGEGGQTYFDKGWTQSIVSEVIDYDSMKLAGTDHDSALADKEKGSLKQIFAEIGRIK